MQDTQDINIGTEQPETRVGKRKLAPFRGDRSLWIIITAMLVISLLVIYSSTVSMAHKNVGGDTSYFMIRQAKFIIFSFIIMFFVHWIDFKVYAKYTRTIFYISVILVFATMFVGESRNDATRWIPVPFFGRFQPSEMLKIALMTLLAVQLGKRSKILSTMPLLPSLTPKGWRLNPQKNSNILNNITKPVVLPVVIACIAIFPMNLSTAAMVFLVAMLLFVVAKIRLKEIGKLLMLGGIALTLVVSVMVVFKVGRAETWLSRIENYAAPLMGRDTQRNEKDKAENFQKEQAQIAIASGGVIGKGPGNSTQRSQLPHPYSDFAYAFIIEEYGIAGAVVIFLLFLWVFYRSGVIMRRCRSVTNALLVMGLSLSITVQAFVNMLVCVGLFPVTGQPLPLISMGGSSVLFTCIAFGMILSVSRQNDAEDLAEAKLLAAMAAGEAIPESAIIDTNDDFSGENERIDSEYNGDVDNYDDYSDEDADYYYDDEEDSIESDNVEEEEDFPFTVVDRNDSTRTTDSKIEKDVIDLY